MVSLVEFLRHVLPSDGYKCWVALKKGERPQQGFTQSVENMAEVLQRIDALGWDAYFACATYKEPGNRRQENAQFVQSFWLDIDAGEGKPYPNADAACAAVDVFCDKVQLPYPTIVYSGGGVHCYWRNDRCFAASEWTAKAKAFKVLAATNGLDADSSRTSDVSSILRAPGTYNYKIQNNPRPVECLELMPDTHAFSGASANENVAGTESSFIGTSAAAEIPSFSEFGDIGKAASAIYTNAEPSNANVAVSQCAQLRGFRDARGNISEPLWYAGLGVLAHCADGHSCAHEWSSGYPSYTPDETDRKFSQAKAASGPTTCERFKSLNPSGCAGCPFAVTSPIVLGRVQKEAAATVAAGAGETFPPLPPGYGMNAKYQITIEIKYKDEKGTEKSYHKPFTNHPIYLSEVRDGETERKQGLFFRQWEPFAGWVEFELSAKTLTSMGSWGELAEHGAVMLDPETRKLFLRYVGAAYTQLVGKDRAMRYDQFGWKDDFSAFYLAGTVYKSDGSKESAAGNNECTLRGKKLQPSRMGSLTKWSAVANRLFVDGCEAQSFALLASFASPLIALVTPPGEGGAILSLVSPEGGKGKSTALTAIASVWGELDAIRLLSSDTQVAKFRTIGVLNNIPVNFDELRSRHPELIAEFVESYTGGRDKHRGRVDGSVNPIDLTWKNILISASNKSLVDAINCCQRAGDDPLSNRVFEVEMKVPKDVVFAIDGDLGDSLIMNRGYAGRAYISYLLQPGVIDYCRTQIKRLIEHYTSVTSAQTSHRYVIRLVASVAVAGMICKHMGLMEFSVERIIEWALKEVMQLAKGVTRFEPVQSLLEIIYESYISDCLIVDKPFHPRQQTIVCQRPTRETHMRYEIAGKRLYVSTNWIRNKLNELGQPYQMVVNELEAQQILLDRARRTSLNAGLDVPGGKVPCWEVDMSHPQVGDVFLKEVLPLHAKAV